MPTTKPRFMRSMRLLILTCFNYLALSGFAQDIPDSIAVSRLSTLPEKYYDKISQKINHLESQLDKKTKKYLKKIAVQEQKLYAKAWKIDPVKAKELFGNVKESYNGLQDKATLQAQKLSDFSKVYSGKLDSLTSAFRFLEGRNVINSEINSKLKNSLGSVSSLQDKLNQTDLIKKFLKERQKLLTEQFEKLGLVKELKQFNKQCYYYSQQIREYKKLLEDPSKLEEKLLGLLVEIPAFRDFFNQNSQLASLFRLPGSSSNNLPAAMTGLQTRASIQQDIINRLGNGADVQRMIQENLQGAQGEINQLKNELNKRLPQGGGSDEELPDFKPNNQKTKSFLQRLETGTNFQTQRAGAVFPASTDFGLSVGYKLNDKSIIGFGASYRVGWGSGWNNIRITHQGLGLRSFVDVRLKRSFFISGGYEQNFRSEIRNFDQLRDQSAWQQSGLIGLSKMVSMKSKFFKKSKAQILWDFLSYDNIPRSQPIIFRIGYTF